MLDQSIHVMSPTSKVWEGNAPAHGDNKCKISVSIPTRSTATKPATPHAYKSLAWPVAVYVATACG